MRRASCPAFRPLMAFLLSLIFVAFRAGPARGAEDCPPVHDLPVPHLPHTRAALATNQPILVVAIGSSSTRGWMASDIGHSYPALLQRYLNDHVPRISAAVINRGIGGQDAPEELARLEAELASRRGG